MACRLTPTAFALAIPLLAGAFAHAQALPDPTRPSGSDAAYGGDAASSGLQSIIRPVGAKPRALINGEVVTLGGKVGDSRLVAIHADSVVLVDADGRRETLTLTPDVSKSPARSKSSEQR